MVGEPSSETPRGTPDHVTTTGPAPSRRTSSGEGEGTRPSIKVVVTLSAPATGDGGSHFLCGDEGGRGRWEVDGNRFKRRDGSERDYKTIGLRRDYVYGPVSPRVRSIKRGTGFLEIPTSGTTPTVRW